jgi:hypothetical protein
MANKHKFASGAMESCAVGRAFRWRADDLWKVTQNPPAVRQRHENLRSGRGLPGPDYRFNASAI